MDHPPAEPLTRTSLAPVGPLPSNLAAGLFQQELPGLNGIRAIAAFMVVLGHAGLERISAGLGVLIFFVLSGFLITWLLLSEQERTSTISLRKFYIRRSLRIFPVFYFFWFLVVGGLLVRHRVVNWPQSIASFLYLNDYYQAIFGDPNTGLSATWSLAVEEQFYIFWPVTFLLLSKDRRKMASVLLWSIGVLWVFRLVMIFAFHVPQGYIYEAFDMRADHLLSGCLLAVSLRTGLFPKLWQWLCSTWWPGALTVAGLIFCSLGETHYGPDFRDTISFIAAPVLSASLIVCAIAFSKQGAWRILDTGVMRYLGRISYSIYLFQGFAIWNIEKISGRYPFWLQLAAIIVATILLASGSYFFVERYFLKLKTRFSTAPVGAPVL
jgi:peptidoglycan/LPS O-acetylase OafA/YrhL